MAPGFFGGVDQFPTALDRRRRRDFDSNMLAMLHSENRHLNMPVPRRCNDDEIQIVACRKCFEGMLAIGVKLRSLLSRLLDGSLRLRCMLLHNIAHGHNLAIIGQEISQ
jgi:hypothetical protein